MQRPADTAYRSTARTDGITGGGRQDGRLPSAGPPLSGATDGGEGRALLPDEAEADSSDQ
ncbi:hypothetical protein [Streptomyces sp. NPDC051286]|uniref:hypothetical protein n=1 Tax=Streptomyces sp. NPDC051286 TaxID=3365647 RepID=UPI00379509E6